MKLLDAEAGGLHARLWRLTGRDDVAEDLMQELVIRLAGSDTFAGADRPAAFAMRTATNLALDWRRKQRRRGARLGPAVAWSKVVGTLPGDGDDPAARVEQDEELDGLLDALAQMKPTDREVLTMRYLEEADYDAVAAALGKTVAQTRGVCFKAVSRLRKQMAERTKTEVNR